MNFITDDEKVLDYKPVFQKFVEANQRLLDCYTAIPKADLAEMPQGAMDTKCAKEKGEIRALLESNQLTMTNLVQDRVNVLYLLNAYDAYQVQKEQL